jgi:hypothetical protein
MIKDELEYKVTQEWIEKLKKSIAAMEQDEIKKRNDPDGWEILQSSLKCHLDRLKEEIAEYETLKNHNERTPIVLKLNDINSLHEILIKARLAAKLSQKELAVLAGLTEEQILLYEAQDYQDASFLDVMAVFYALDIKIQHGEFLCPLDSLRRTPITHEELLLKTKNLATH